VWCGFERGARKTGGNGWADVWQRGCFGWEYKGKPAWLDDAFPGPEHVRPNTIPGTPPAARGFQGPLRPALLGASLQDREIVLAGVHKRGAAVKVEIGESLIYSWLRHVHGCVLAQLNWKPSPAWDAAGRHELEQDFQALRDFVDQYMSVRIFKDVSFRQFIHQAEIDVLGLRFDGNTRAHVLFAVDSAFHENGLQYGGSEETVARVLMKLVRSAFACRAYFPARELHLIFATPKMHNGAREVVEGHLAKLVPWLLARWALVLRHRACAESPVLA
jgi:hypothetical protein